MLKQVSEKISPTVQEQTGGAKKLGKVVLGTVEGDIHDIAKDICRFMLDINGFEVIDLAWTFRRPGLSRLPRSPGRRWSA